MAEKKRITAYSFLDEYRGTLFNGEWPTLPELFKISTKRFGERNCFTDFLPQRRTLTYNAALETILTLAQFLRSRGVGKGDRVAVSGKNSTEWVCVYLATNFCGAIIVPIDYSLRDDEIQNLLNASRPKLFFVDEERFETFSASLQMEVFSLSTKFSEKYVFSLKADKEYELESPVEEDVAAILFTSGTTGNPKGVMLTHKNFVSCCFIAQANLKLYCTDVFYALLPIHHSYTMQAVFIESLSVGAETVFGKTMAVTKMMKELREGKITMFLGVPLLFNKLLDGIMKGVRKKGPIVYGIIRALMGLSYAIKKLTGKNPGRVFFGSILKKANLSNIRIMISGGGPLAPAVFKQYNQLGVDFVQGYGLTETAPILTLNPKENFKIDSVGRFDRNDMTIKILDPDERGVGEIVVKGPMVMKGYYNMPEETAAVFTEDG
ncbi:MAG: acyl--CoA ligase, partial [Spirochaetaceae bacterium]|nr:acyl--CoA ligase [Spirochaetaceae bacterium]